MSGVPRSRLLNLLFSDRHGRVRLAGVFALLLSLGLYHRHLARCLALSYAACNLDPTRCDGALLFLELHRVAAITAPNRYHLAADPPIPIEGPTADLRLAELVSVRGRFRARDALVVEEARRAHPHRAAKEGLAMLGVILVGLAAPVVFRLHSGRIQVRG